MSRDEFISAATEIYGDKYDYSSVDEQNVKYNSNIAIKCNKHGLFYTTPYHFLHGAFGCFECYREEKQGNDKDSYKTED